MRSSAPVAETLLIEADAEGTSAALVADGQASPDADADGRMSPTDDCTSPLPSATATPTDAYERLDAEEDTRLRNFKQGESLGRGAYGEVFKAMVAGRFMAVKRIRLDLSLSQKAAEKEIQTILLEINTLKRLRHPRIVRYHGCIRQQDSDDGPSLLIFLEFMPSGSIKGVLSKFGPYGLGLVRKYTRQILEGLDFLHQERIVHRDVKGANILIDAQGDAKLADFGACRELEALQSTVTGGMKSIHGSIFWMAPEIMKYKAGRRSDIWSLGCTVIEMITAEAPWPNLRLPGQKLSMTEMLQRIADGTDSPPIPDKVRDNHDCRTFLERALVRDHTKRPYAAQLLKHRFVAQDAAPGAAPVPKGASEAWANAGAALAPQPGPKLT